MKKYILLFISIMVFDACSYDDSDITDRVDALTEKIMTVENQISEINTSINTLSEIIDKMNSGMVIMNTEKLDNGYKLIFSDNSTITLLNGTDGKDGADAPIIGVKKLHDKYYWTATSDGMTSWLLDADGNRISAEGKNGITPIMGVDDEKYWTVDLGNGPHRIVPNIKADGTTKSGDSIFKKIEDKSSVIILTLQDGTEIQIPKVSGSGVFDKYTMSFIVNHTKIIDMNLDNLLTIKIFYVSDGWKANINGAQLNISAPDFEDKDALITLIGMNSDGNTVMASLKCDAITTAIHLQDGDASYLLPNIKYADLDSLVTELNSIYYSVSLNKEKENIEVYASNPRYDNMLFSTAIYQYINYGRKGFNFQYSYKNSNISEKLKKTVMQTYMSKNFMIKEIYNY